MGKKRRGKNVDREFIEMEMEAHGRKQAAKAN